jgi:hypothetical protein
VTRERNPLRGRNVKAGQLGKDEAELHNDPSVPFVVLRAADPVKPLLSKQRPARQAPERAPGNAPGRSATTANLPAWGRPTI